VTIQEKEDVATDFQSQFEMWQEDRQPNKIRKMASLNVIYGMW
jgi:hypothetical protein